MHSETLWKLLTMCHVSNRTGQKLGPDRFGLVSLITFSHFHQTFLKQRCSQKVIPFSPKLVPAVAVKQDISFTKQLQGTSRMQSVGTEYAANYHFLTNFDSTRKFLINSSYQLITREKVLGRCIYQCYQYSKAITSLIILPEKNLPLQSTQFGSFRKYYAYSENSLFSEHVTLKQTLKKQTKHKTQNNQPPAQQLSFNGQFGTHGITCHSILLNSSFPSLSCWCLWVVKALTFVHFFQECMQTKIILLFDNCSSPANRIVMGKRCVVLLWAQAVRVDSLTLEKVVIQRPPRSFATICETNLRKRK